MGEILAVFLNCERTVDFADTEHVRGDGTQASRRARSSALAVIRYGCFVPDLTRFTAPRCEGARRMES